MPQLTADSSRESIGFGKSSMTSQIMQMIHNRDRLYMVQILPLSAEKWITVHCTTEMVNARQALYFIDLEHMNEVINARIYWIDENGNERTKLK